jgi:anti-sigma factor RsiW
MTAEDSMSETRDCGGEVAAYALGALEPHEADAFREHLTTCVVCRDELAAFQNVVDALPMAAPQQPVPRGLRRRVRGAIHAEPKAAPNSVRRRAVAGGLVRRPALVGSVLLVAALATAGGLELASGGSGGAKVIQARVTGSPGSAELRVAGGRAELIVRHLPQPPAGHVYEVWLKRSGQTPSPTSALFSVTRTGAGDVGVPGDLQGVSEVLVTPEPAGGSLAPTHSPVIVAALT